MKQQIVPEDKLTGQRLRQSFAMWYVQFLSCLDRFELNLQVTHGNVSFLCQWQTEVLKRLFKPYRDLSKIL